MSETFTQNNTGLSVEVVRYDGSNLAEVTEFSELEELDISEGDVVVKSEEAGVAIMSSDTFDRAYTEEG